MFPFGEKLERSCIDFASERAKLKKGNVLGRRRSREPTSQTNECLVLPNITTTQLTQNFATNCGSWKTTGKGINSGQDKKPVHQLIGAGRLKDATFTILDSEDQQFSNFEGLFVSKLNLQRENFEDDTTSEPASRTASKRTKQDRRLSKTDSGFYEDSNDDVAINRLGSPNGSDKASNASNSSVSSREQQTTAFSRPSFRSSRNESRRRVTLDFKTILAEDKVVVRNTERLSTPAHMCTQSHRSLHADLVAFKSFAAAGNTNSDPTLCVRMKEVQLENDSTRGSIEDAVKQNYASLTLLKTRRRLLGERKFSEQRSPCYKKEEVFDRISAECDEKNRSQSSDLERRTNLGRRSCTDLIKSRLQDDDSREKSDEFFKSVRPSSSLTTKALSEAKQSENIINVDDKCKAWLNQWLAVNGSSSIIQDAPENACRQ